ncbi:MAG: hypothetical protein LV481_05285 [Methylacidiphilales bacterium]|nr:hypothetical protein [Candidatus Methylacidiphilales bacterium]
MNIDPKDLLNSVRLPGKLNEDQTACLLGFQGHDIWILNAAKLLKPLGDPEPNCVKYFDSADVVAKAADRKWLHKATACVYRHWRNNHASRIKK